MEWGPLRPVPCLAHGTPRDHPWDGPGPMPDFWVHCDDCGRDYWPTYRQLLMHELRRLRETSRG
jgi:hypothetical protein